jgi:hypothetical protein
VVPSPVTPPAIYTLLALVIVTDESEDKVPELKLLIFAVLIVPVDIVLLIVPITKFVSTPVFPHEVFSLSREEKFHDRGLTDIFIL